MLIFIDRQEQPPRGVLQNGFSALMVKNLETCVWRSSVCNEVACCRCSAEVFCRTDFCRTLIYLELLIAVSKSFTFVASKVTIDHKNLH